MADYRIVHSEITGSKPMTARVLWELPRVGAPAPGPGGFAVTVTQPSIQDNKSSSAIYGVFGQGTTQRLTREGLSASTPVFSPSGQQLAFLGKDEESAQVFVLPMQGGEAQRVSEFPLGAFDIRWLPDESGLIVGAFLYEDALSVEATTALAQERRDEPPQVFRTEQRFYRFWDEWLPQGTIPHLFRIDLETGDTTDLMPESRLWFDWMDPAGAFDVSPDGAEIAFEGLHVAGPDNRLREDVFTISTTQPGTPTNRTASNPANSLRPRYAPDGKSLVYGRTVDPNFYADRSRLVRLTGDSHEEVLSDWDRNPQSWEFAPDGTLFLQAEDRAGVRIYRYDFQGDPSALTTEASCTSPRVTDEAIYFLRQSLTEPAEVWQCDHAGDAHERLSHFTANGLQDVARGEVQETYVSGANGDDVQTFVLFPPGHDKSKPAPLVHMIHGGPHGTFGDVWHIRWNAQVVASQGYVVALVNFHGSTSWGQDYAQSIQGAWGDAPYTDVMAATDELIAQGWVDEAKMAATGGSYGGYLTTWITSQTTRFACAINHAGVYDTSLQYAGDVTWGWHQAFGSAPWDDLGKADRWNPARHMASVETPTLVMHGQLDYRVPADNAMLCYGMLQARNIPSRLVFFRDENHWIRKPQNSLLWYEEFTGWLRRFLT